MINNQRQTLYELAQTFDNDIQNEGLPKLTQWLFSKYYSQFEGTLQQGIAAEFISAFIRKYLNREIFHKSKDVFKSSLYYELEKYFDYLSTVQDEYKNLISADIGLNETESIDRNLMDVTLYDGSIDTTNEGTLKNTGTITSEGTNTRTDDLTQNINTNNTRTDNLSSNTTSQNIGTVGIAERNIASDYPQSNVSQGVDPIFNYDYASGSNDRHTTETRDTSNTSNTTNTGTQSNEGTNTTKNTGTSKNTTDNTQTNDLTSTTNNTGSSTSNSKNDKTVDEGIKKQTKRDSISAFDKLLKILDYLDKNPYSPIYTVIEKMDKYFISMYVDEDRDGYIADDINLLKYIVGGISNE